MDLLPGADQLLVWDVGSSWLPLCQSFGVSGSPYPSGTWMKHHTEEHGNWLHKWLPKNLDDAMQSMGWVLTHMG